jgi:hypothetical protein
MTPPMAYLRIQRKGRLSYYMIQRNERRGGKVVQRILEYLGRDPDPGKLKRALAYWKVKPKEEGRRDR